MMLLVNCDLVAKRGKCGLAVSDAGCGYGRLLIGEWCDSKTKNCFDKILRTVRCVL